MMFWLNDPKTDGKPETREAEGILMSYLKGDLQQWHMDVMFVQISLIIETVSSDVPLLDEMLQSYTCYWENLISHYKPAYFTPL